VVDGVMRESLAPPLRTRAVLKGESLQRLPVVEGSMVQWCGESLSRIRRLACYTRLEVGQ
jgi:hypothetical protein